MRGLYHMMQKNLGFFFQERILEILTKIKDVLWNFWKILKKLTQFWRNLLKILQEILSCEEFLKISFI